MVGQISMPWTRWVQGPESQGGSPPPRPVQRKKAARETGCRTAISRPSLASTKRAVPARPTCQETSVCNIMFGLLYKVETS
jgi:hypothetical protein